MGRFWDAHPEYSQFALAYGTLWEVLSKGTSLRQYFPNSEHTILSLTTTFFPQPPELGAALESEVSVVRGVFAAFTIC